MYFERIMAESKIGRVRTGGDEGKLRVAAYCRVSTDNDTQLTSYEAQIRYYRQRISADPGWKFAGIYADEGVSGTRAEHREGFQQMIQDCEDGKIGLILTKSISRFARNTLECLTYIRRLQAIGVNLVFEKENIDTRAAHSEMLLTILAAFAQEESRSISENVKWGIRKRYEKGMDRWTRIYGYTADGDKTYIIVPEEAEIVRRIFSLYEHGKSMAQIRDNLNAAHIPNPAGNMGWQAPTVMNILRSEKYVGDILLQKVYNEDHLSHRKVKNDMTEIPGYYMEGHHDAIVDRKTYDRVQKIRGLNCQGGSGGRPGQSCQYPFSDLLICPHCGKPLTQRKLMIQDHSRAWGCDGGCEFMLKNNLVEAAVLAAAGKKGTKEASVEFFWLDEYVDHIGFGKHTGKEDRTVTVFWKDGSAVTVPSGADRESQNPAYLARRHEACRQRAAERAAGMAMTDAENKKEAAV